MQCWLAFHYTLHGACNRQWTRPRGSSSRHQIKCDHIAPLLRQLHWLKVPWRIDYKLAVLVYKCLHGLVPSYLADELHHRAESEFRRRLRSASFHELSIYFPYPTLNLRRPSFSYGSGTVFRSISHLLRHFLSSALVWRHTSSNSVTRNYCCRASEVTLSFMDTLIALT